MSEDDQERRDGVGEDRRQKPTPMISRYTFRGRRRGGRRDGERDNVYVDKPGPWIIAAFWIVVGLSGLDAWYTLDLLAEGKATEANPLMRAALELGDAQFVIIKTAMTIIAAGFLCLHKNWSLGRLCLVLAIAGYSLLILYHLAAQREAAKMPPVAVLTAPTTPAGG